MTISSLFLIFVGGFIGFLSNTAVNSKVATGLDMNEVWYVIIGAVIGFVASIGTVIVERLLDRHGKLKIYYKISGKQNIIAAFGFRQTVSGEMSFNVSMQIEIQNTSKSTRVIRNVNVVLYFKGKPGCSMVQVTTATQRERKDGQITEQTNYSYGTESGAYSFVVDPRSILHQKCSFALLANHTIQPFDEIRLRYFDERDKEHSFHLRDIENCWEARLLDGDDDWILLK